MTPVPEPDPSRARFLALLAQSIEQRHFIKLLLTDYRGVDADLQRASVRLIELRGQPTLAFVYSYQTRDITKNQPLAEGLALVDELLGPTFRNAHLFTPEGETQLAISRKGRSSLRIAKGAPGDASAGAAPGGAGSTAHNREKHRLLDLQRPFLAALGVADARGQLVPAMARKWKQINKFVEIFDAALAASPLADAPVLNVADFGCGKGYLTFAVHDHLRHRLGREARVTGVDLRADMVALCNTVAAQLELPALHFEHGDLSAFKPRPLDVVIALHACDTATDHALHLGLRTGAQIIICAPCCHQQLRGQLLAPHPMRAVLQHGVHLGQEAEMLTDSLRALLLQAHGYETQVFEFVALEHTAKNKMILAVKSKHPVAPDEVWAQVQEVKRFYGIREQCLESLITSAL